MAGTGHRLNSNMNSEHSCSLSQPTILRKLNGTWAASPSKLQSRLLEQERRGSWEASQALEQPSSSTVWSIFRVWYWFSVCDIFDFERTEFHYWVLKVTCCPSSRSSSSCGCSSSSCSTSSSSSNCTSSYCSSSHLEAFILRWIVCQKLKWRMIMSPDFWVELLSMFLKFTSRRLAHCL